jgi:tetratricopeptide (TPR) repeat protein
MGFWDSLFGRRRPSSPEEVREALFDAARRGDAAALAKLAEEHEAGVLEHFGGWAKVPEALRRDPAAVQAYAQGLIGVAQHFAEVRGRPELIARLAGPPADNPLVRWERALKEADARMEEGDYEGAAELFRAALDGVKGLSGSGVDRYLPVTLGRIGSCLFQMGDADGAAAPFERALALCEAQGDDEGTRAYLGNLQEVQRYRGDAEAAARYLERLADLHARLDDPALAVQSRRRAGIVRAGEPLCRVVAEVDGELVEIPDLRPSTKHARFVFVRNRVTLQRSSVAVAAGVAAGEAGDFEGALAHFERAAAADRFDPWPSYHGGHTQIRLRRYREAVESFRRTEELAPGWYHCRAGRWMATELVAGALDHGLFERISALVDGALPPDRALAEARRALAQKELGVIHLVAGDALARLDRGTEAEAAYRRGLAIAEEPDVKTRLLVALGGRVEDRRERARLLAEAGELRGNLVAAAMAAMLSRAAAVDVN